MLREFDTVTWLLVAAGLLIAGVIFLRDRKQGQAYVWDPRPPTLRERVICGLWLAAFVPASVNHLANWQLFRGYDQWVFGGLLLVGLNGMARLPGVRRV